MFEIASNGEESEEEEHAVDDPVIEPDEEEEDFEQATYRIKDLCGQKLPQLPTTAAGSGMEERGSHPVCKHRYVKPSPYTQMSSGSVGSQHRR